VPGVSASPVRGKSVSSSGGMAGVAGQSMLLRGAASFGLAALMWTGVGFNSGHFGHPAVGESVAADGSLAVAAEVWETTSGVVEVAATTAWTGLALGALVVAGGGLLLTRRRRVAG
jgi:hypothetical protein